MLAVVKEPHIELALGGAPSAVKSLVNFIRTRYTVDIIKTSIAFEESENGSDESVNIFETDYWKNVTPGSLLQGYRLKHNLTQKQLSELCGIHHVVLSAYETGKRKLSKRAAAKIARALNEPEDIFFKAIVNS